VVLLNTDWTSAGNRKEVVLHAAGFGDIPLSVREGRLTQVLLRGDVAVAFETLPVIVDDLRLDAAGASFRAGGAGRAAVRVFSQRDGAGATVDGRPAVFQNGALAMDFGETWTTRQVRIRFA